MLRYARRYAAFSLGRGSTGERANALARLRHLVDVPGILVMRLLECRETTAIFTEDELVEGLSLIESDVLLPVRAHQDAEVSGLTNPSLARTISANHDRSVRLTMRQR